MKIGDTVRIVNETGQGQHTKVLDVDGRDITRDQPIRAARLQLAVGELNTVELELLAPQFDVVAEVTEVTRPCPYCGQETDEDARDDAQEGEHDGSDRSRS